MVASERFIEPNKIQCTCPSQTDSIAAKTTIRRSFMSFRTALAIPVDWIAGSILTQRRLAASIIHAKN